MSPHLELLIIIFTFCNNSNSPNCLKIGLSDFLTSVLKLRNKSLITSIIIWEREKERKFEKMAPNFATLKKSNGF